jgi:putative SOS response-associated peptidase YedK
VRVAVITGEDGGKAVSVQVGDLPELLTSGPARFAAAGRRIGRGRTFVNKAWAVRNCPLRLVNAYCRGERIMCGRFALFAAGDELAERFQVNESPLLSPRYNVAPTQSIAAVRATPAGRALNMLRWGLIPSWASDPKIAYKLLNARSETVAEKPSFRAAFKQRRCLIPASGFYEWQKGSGKTKQPFFIRPRDGGLFSFAGLWECWHDPKGATVETCTILTTGANELMRPIHDRMPVILDSASEGAWLDPSASPDALRALFVPFASERMEAYAVSPWVSNARNQGERCIEPVDVS